MDIQAPVKPEAEERRRWRSGRRGVAALALTAVVGAGACGAASAVEPPLALSRAVDATFEDEGSMTIRLAASSPDEPEMAEVLDQLALEVGWTSSHQVVRVLVDDSVGAEVLTSDEQFCLRVDIEAFSPLADWEPGEIAAQRDEAVAGIAQQLGGPLGGDVERLANGEWGCLSVEALEELQASMPDDMGSDVDPMVLEQLTEALTGAADGLVDPWSVREEGEDDALGRHLVASVDAVELSEAIAGFMDTLQAELAEIGGLDQLGGIAGMSGVEGIDEMAGGQWSTAVREALAGASGEIQLDTWVKDGELTRARMDLVAAAASLSGETPPEGTSAVVTMDFDGDADMPDVSGAVDLDGFIALAGMAAASLGQGGF